MKHIVSISNETLVYSVLGVVINQKYFAIIQRADLTVCLSDMFPYSSQICRIIKYFSGWGCRSLEAPIGFNIQLVDAVTCG